VITGASDDDPSGIVTYSQTGAATGTSLIWLVWLTTPLMIAAQEMSARIGLVQGKGLAAVIQKRWPHGALFVSVLLLVANTINIGANVAAMGAVAKLMFDGSEIWYTIGFALLIIVLEVTISYKRYVTILRWLTLSLLAYVATAFAVNIQWGSVASDFFIPHLTINRDTILLVVAILGTTISPYLFFWQASEEVEELHGKKLLNKKNLGGWIHRMRLDTATGMIASNVVMFFIIVTTAVTLHQQGITTISSAADAAQALVPVAGKFAFFLFGLGIIGTGLLAVPVLAGSAAYAVSEVFHWREGLSRTFRQAPQFYVVIALAVMVGLVTTMVGVNPMQMLLWAAVVNGLVAPVMLFLLLRLSDDPKIVGTARSPQWVRVSGWAAFLFMTLAAVGVFLV